LKKELSHTSTLSVDKDKGERIVRFHFAGNDELGRDHERILIAQLTGRASNLFLLSPDGTILTQARAGRGVGQLAGEKYQPPLQQTSRAATKPTNAARGISPTVREGSSVSEALDAHFTATASEQSLKTQEEAARAKLRQQISQRQKLLTKLEADLASHANFEQHKRIGDLLLANVASAKRTGNVVKLIDYFAEGAPECDIEVDEKQTLPEEAARRFEMYSRSKRAVGQITARIKKVKSEIASLSEPSAVAGGPADCRLSIADCGLAVGRLLICNPKSAFLNPKAARYRRRF
jgi:predicted ribosome quality control (RQC) complex YloA/Tae2 family protein